MSKTGSALVWGGAVRVASMGITLLVMMMIVPLTVRQLGDRYNGVWVQVSMLMGAYGMLDLGLGSAVSRFVSRALGRHDLDDADRIVTTAVYLYSGAALICIGIVITIASLSGRFFRGNPEDAALFHDVILVTGIAFAISFPSRCHNGVLDAYLRYDLSGYIDIGVSMVRAGLFAAVLLMGGKLMALATVAAVMILVRGAMAVMCMHRVHRPTKLDPSLLRREDVRTLTSYASITFVAQCADFMRMQAYPIIIPSFLNLAAVTMYDLAYKPVGAAVRLTAALLATTTPVFSRQDARGDAESLRWSYLFSYKIACYIAVFFVGMMAMLGEPFILRWVGEKYRGSIPIYHLLLVGACFGICQTPTIHFMYGTSRHVYFAVANLIEGVVNVGLGVLFMSRYGPIGLAAAVTLAALLSNAVILPAAVCRPLGISLIGYHCKHTLPYMLTPAIFMGVIYLAARPFFAPAYLRLVEIVSLAAILFVPYVLYVGFDKRQRRLILDSILGSRRSPRQDQTAE